GLATAQAAHRQMLGVQSTGLAEQLVAARVELAQLEDEIDTRQEQLRLANETLRRFEQLRGHNYVSELQLKQQQSAALDHVGQMQALHRQAAATLRILAQLQQALGELPSQRQAGEAGFERDSALLEQEHVETLARGELAVTAPVSGIIATQLF